MCKLKGSIHTKHTKIFYHSPLLLCFHWFYLFYYLHYWDFCRRLQTMKVNAVLLVVLTTCLPKTVVAVKWSEKKSSCLFPKRFSLISMEKVTRLRKACKFIRTWEIQPWCCEDSIGLNFTTLDVFDSALLWREHNVLKMDYLKHIFDISARVFVPFMKIQQSSDKYCIIPKDGLKIKEGIEVSSDLKWSSRWQWLLTLTLLSTFIYHHGFRLLSVIVWKRVMQGIMGYDYKSAAVHIRLTFQSWWIIIWIKMTHICFPWKTGSFVMVSKRCQTDSDLIVNLCT